jgi:uncharacterized membrane protein YhaH (DUF805 family)
MNFFRNMVSSKGDVSSKRFLGGIGFISLIIAMFITLYYKFDLEVGKRLIESVEYISIAYGLGTVVEKFANKTQTTENTNNTI